MKALSIVGIAVIAVGLLLIIEGGILAWGEYKQRKTYSGAAEFVTAVKDLVVAIAESGRASLGCFAFGTILVLLGGVIAGVGGLV
jgi:hypothetical protein